MNLNQFNEGRKCLIIFFLFILISLTIKSQSYAGILGNIYDLQKLVIHNAQESVQKALEETVMSVTRTGNAAKEAEKAVEKLEEAAIAQDEISELTEKNAALFASLKTARNDLADAHSNLEKAKSDLERTKTKLDESKKELEIINSKNDKFYQISSLFRNGLLRIPAKTATYSGNNFTTYPFIQFPC